MSAAKAQNGRFYNLENVKLPAAQEQTSSQVAQDSKSQTPLAQAHDAPSQIAPDVPKVATFLGNIDKVSKISQQLAVTRCLNSVTGGNKSPWKAYPGHSKLITLDMDLNGIREADQFHSTLRENSHIKDWLEWRIQPDTDDLGRRSSKARLKLLLVTLNGGETVSSSAKEDADVLQEVFNDWSFPTAALSVLLDRRATCMDQHTVMNATKKAGKPSAPQTNRVYCVGMRQWSMVWSPSSYDPPFGARGVIMCVDKTWASSVPGVVTQYLKTMWMFLGFQGILPLVACMASLRYAASALAEDDKEAFRREFELRSWLKGGFNAEKKDLGYTSAQVSWLSSRVSRHRDRLAVTNRMLGILKEDLDMYEIFTPGESFEILRNCICNLADMKEHLRAQARQLEAQANVQLAALFNLITQKDSATALIIAKTSQTIAADSRRDQKVSVDIANSSRAIAYNTLRDSASMKAIANVTMVFLPGTFMASVFAMPFFSAQQAMGFFVNTKIWIYVAITIPLTLLTLACAWFWYHVSARSHQPLHEDDAEGSQSRLTRSIMNGRKMLTDINPGHISMSSPAEKNIGRLAYVQDEERLSDSLELDMDFDHQDHNTNDFEHWDPMTREFAPSMFAASSFAFTEDSELAKSGRSSVAFIEPESATAKPLEVLEPSRLESTSWGANVPSLPDPNAKKLREKVAEEKARMVERRKAHSRREDAARVRESRKSPGEPRRRAYVETDDEDSGLEAVFKSSSPARLRPMMESRSSRRALSPDASIPSRSQNPASRQSFSKPTTPTRASFLKHVETPNSARDRNEYVHSMVRSYSDGARAEKPTRRPQSRSPQGSRIERPVHTPPPSRTRYQIVEPSEDDDYRRHFQSSPKRPERPEPARISKKVESNDYDRGRDQYWSGRTRSGSGDSFKSRGSGHSHKGYSY